MAVALYHGPFGGAAKANRWAAHHGGTSQKSDKSTIAKYLNNKQ